MKEELSLLARLIEKNLEPIVIQDLVAKMSYIPVNWGSDRGIFSEQLLQSKDKRPGGRDTILKNTEETKNTEESEETGKAEKAEKETEKKRFLFDVRYIFS